MESSVNKKQGDWRAVRVRDSAGAATMKMQGKLFWKNQAAGDVPRARSGRSLTREERSRVARSDGSSQGRTAH